MAPRGGHAAAASSGSEEEEEEVEFSRSYFLAKEKEPSSGKKRARSAAGKLSDLNLVDEQVLRASLAEVPPKHEEVEALTGSYKEQYRKWLFELSTAVWDKKMVHTQFKWSWYHVPTFAPYKVECVFYPLILASGGRAQSTKTALVVLQSLTPNAQSVFRVLAEYQLANKKEEGEITVQGMPVSSLYTKCRERFLVSSQVTLNSHLTEFKDHDLIKTRKHSDGQDCLRIPLFSDALEKLLQELA
ncbi:hypothetical protein PR202_ga19907 [Eleusine coracana subsp. coracana]|uniref:Origin recognition complex subunit 2 winged-helix domain-containing protein n=1 Tax=Eleusine coracana subsp. coracana TaxID=191504 RepID=A0AAV5CXM9_ELECO|nr:hypothetical protein PR202_ga19907 [Eleusine coracana subsp. coracana]